MAKSSKTNDSYTRPIIRTMAASQIVESLGPVSAGSGASVGALSNVVKRR